MTRVLVLGGGPDAEREVSIASAKGVHQGCLDAGLDATLLTVDTPTVDDIRSWNGDVIFPVLHGKFGEGGGLQSRLESAAVPFVGAGFAASALAMDKLATKLLAARLGIPTPEACVLDGAALLKSGTIHSPIKPPVVVKPVHDGSSVGLHICRDEAQWQKAQRAIRSDIERFPQRTYMIERFRAGRELTASVISNPENPRELIALPLIEIAPKEGVYDYEAKYQRNDTIYTVSPSIDPEITHSLQTQAVGICNAIGVRHLARADFLLSSDGSWTMLEVNTMPGFTATSLLPKAAGAFGLPMPMFCEHLVRCALGNSDAKKPIVQG